MSGGFQGKKVLVMGLGLHGGGTGTVKFLLKSGAIVTVTDLRKKGVLKPSLDKLRGLKNVRFVLGRHKKEDFENADIILKNPAVLPDSPYLKYAASAGIPITSDIAIFLNYSPARVIGITGTRGKSTTASILTEFLRMKFERVFIGGNIRKSALELLPRLKKQDWVILELSSFQLHDLGYERTRGAGPHIAIITNILEDHLNWHKNFSYYVHAKSNIFKFQGPDDYLFLNPEDLTLRGFKKKARAKIIFPRLEKKYKKIVEKNLGRHYFTSIALAIAAAKKLGVGNGAIKKVLNKYKGLEGREEKIALIRGVHFINDTTATSPDAVIAALNRFRNVISKKNKLILISGGGSKGLNFSEVSKKIAEKTEVLILLPGSATEKIKQALNAINFRPKTLKVTRKIKSMREAVRVAYQYAKRGDYIILSPGADSFNIFLNEFDRGDKFVEAVRLLKKKDVRFN